jgi:outer membrane protein
MFYTLQTVQTVLKKAMYRISAFLKLVIPIFEVLFYLLIGVNARAETAQESYYQSLSLEDCLALAVKYNPVLGGANERILELAADYQAAKSRFFPRLALVSYYQRLDPNRFPPGGNVSNQELFKGEGLVSLSGKQILFDGFKTYHNTRATEIGIQAQKREVRRTADDVAFIVTEAFYRLVEAKENLKVAAEALKQRQEFAALTDAFFKAGKITRLDSFRAQSQVSQAEQAMVEAENSVSLAREILARSIGLKEQMQVDILGQLPQEFAPAADMHTLWQKTLNTNPEIKRLNFEIEQNQILIKAVRGAYFPEVSLQGAAGVRYRDPGGTREEWLAGVFIDFPVFEGGLTKAQVAKASSQYLQSLDRKSDRLNSLKADLTTAWKDQENALQGVAATRQTVSANEEAYASAQTLYRNGKTIGLDVLQAQVDLTASRFNLIRYAVTYEIARARIRQILGLPDLEPSGKCDSGGPEK